MTTFHSIRLTRFALFALLAIGSLLSGCKKTGSDVEPDVDPRDQVVGTYEGGFAVTITIGTLPFGPETGSLVATITKGSNPKQIIVQNNYANGGYMEKVTAELQADGVSYLVIDKNSDQINFQGKKFDADYTATAVFDVSKSAFGYSAVSRGLQSGTEVKRTIDITGNKK